MPIDATITFDSLECFAEHDTSGGSEPYLWPIYLWTDPALVGQARFVELSTASIGEPSAPLAIDARAGDTLDLPFPPFTRRLADGARGIGVVVVALEADETPDTAMTVGRNVLRDALGDELRAFALAEGRAPRTGDVEGEEDEVTPIVERVEPQVEDAIADQLNVFQKLRNQDDVLGHAFAFFDLGDVSADDQEIVLDVVEDSRQHYRVRGALRVRETVPVRPRCPRRRDALRRARARLQSVEMSIADLQELLGRLPGSAKAQVAARIREQQSRDLPRARAMVSEAERALDACLARAREGATAAGSRQARS
ncbi:MAG: hypothetical protein ACLGI5_20230 [Thermoleophilia bacterium]